MKAEIVCALIEAMGTILAAAIGVGWLGKIVKKNMDTYFFSYSDTKHDLHRIMRRAKNSLTIVVAYGDRLLESYGNEIESYLKRGIQVEYLMLDREHAFSLDRDYYQKKEQETAEALDRTLRKLEKLSQYENLQIRESNLFLSASYIGVDLYEPLEKRGVSPVIQVMIYQFGIRTPQSPITYLFPDANPRQFETTAECIQKMWEHGKPLDIKQYRKSLTEFLTPGTVIAAFEQKT